MAVTTPLRRAELDRELLCKALRTMIRRYESSAKDAGYDDRFIERSVESEVSLVNRIELGMEVTK